MKRWTFRISPRRAASGGVLCLLLVSGGVVTTVAVAWGLAAFAPFWPSLIHTAASPRDGDYIKWWNDNCAYAGASTITSTTSHDIVFTVETPGLEVVFANEKIGRQGPGSWASLLRVWAGLPAKSLSAAKWSSDRALDRSTRHFSAVVDAIAVDQAGLSDDAKTLTFLMNGRLLPLRPILPGFLINTLFYAVIWFGLFFGIGAARRRIRRGYLRGRGRCEKCGYDLRGTPDDVGEERKGVRMNCLI